MLYIFGGLPGTGKSTLAQYLARAQQAVHLRIDSIEQSLREVAMHSGVPYVEIEVICSYAAAHRARVETRATDIAGLRLPT